MKKIFFSSEMAFLIYETPRNASYKQWTFEYHKLRNWKCFISTTNKIQIPFSHSRFHLLLIKIQRKKDQQEKLFNAGRESINHGLKIIYSTKWCKLFSSSKKLVNYDGLLMWLSACVRRHWYDLPIIVVKHINEVR